MITIVAADDEALEREAIRRFTATMVFDEPVELLPATTGREAVDLAREHDADIVLLDIRMPGMNGLEAGRQLAMLAKPPVMVMITAYDYFEHARTALRQGAIEYLLKPVSREEYEAVLHKAIAEVHRRRGIAEANARAVAAAELEQSLRQRLVHDLGLLKIDEEELQRYASLRFGRKPWHMIAVALGIASGVRTAAVQRYVHVQAATVLVQALSAAVDAVLLQADTGDAALLLVLQPAAADASDEAVHGSRPRGWIEAGSRFRAAIKREVGADCRMGISSGARGAMGVLRAALTALRLTGPQHPVLHLAPCMRDSSNDRGPGRSMPSGSDQIVGQCLHWLQDHFMEPVGLTDLAAAVHLSPEHLSRLLSNTTGEGFAALLASIRIVRAEELLREGCTAKEASLLAGFRDQSHFSKVFRRLTGLSPSEYQVRTRETQKFTMPPMHPPPDT
ncbi:MAG: helix-turn-helix domain-containing protein [Rectinemataceae bacterium]|nr:helix-turn-helix domain-containing protein [Spirochaetaceae bacterium]